MTTFSYTSGDPTNLTGGATADLSDISGPFADITTFVNGNIDATNLATSAKPVTVLAPYKTVAEAAFQFTSGGTGSSGTYYPTSGVPGKSASTTTYTVVTLTLTPTDFAVSPLNTRFRVVGSMVTGSVAAGINFTYGLHPVTASTGSGVSLGLTLDTAVSGSTVTRTAPSATSQYQDASSAFAVSSAGVYALGVALSGAITSNAHVACTLRLEVHHS